MPLERQGGIALHALVGARLDLVEVAAMPQRLSRVWGVAQPVDVVSVVAVAKIAVAAKAPENASHECDGHGVGSAVAFCPSPE